MAADDHIDDAAGLTALETEVGAARTSTSSSVLLSVSITTSASSASSGTRRSVSLSEDFGVARLLPEPRLWPSPVAALEPRSVA